MNTNTPALKVRTIIESVGDYSQVVVSREVFDATKGFKPAMPYETTRNAAGQGVRVFDFGGVKLYVRRNKEEGTTKFIMKTNEAQSHLLTLEDERKDEPSLAFAF